MIPSLLYYFLAGGSNSGTGPTYFHIHVADLNDPATSDWRIAVTDLTDAPALTSIAVETL